MTFNKWCSKVPEACFLSQLPSMEWKVNGKDYDYDSTPTQLSH